MTFTKIMPWHWSDQPNRNREKPRAQHQQKFKPSTFGVKVLCSTNKHMLSLLSVIIQSKLDFQILNYVSNQNYFILCIIKFIHIY